MIDDLLSALVGIEGRYISIKRRINNAHGNDVINNNYVDFFVAFHVDPSMDLALQVCEFGFPFYRTSNFTLTKYLYILV